MPERIAKVVTFGGEILYAECPDRRLRVRSPFRVLVERHHDGIVARVDSLGEFGYGQYLGEALHDLGKTIAELHFALKGIDDSSLSKDLQNVRATLSRHLEERPH